MTLDDISTPALVIDAEKLEANLARMAARATALGVTLRPHIKTHKCVEIGRRQLEHGACGITVSTLYEAEVFAEHGFTDVTWAFPFVVERLEQARALADKIDLGVTVDSLETTAALERSGVPFKTWLKVDCGYHRAGVDPAAPGAGDLAERLAGSGTLRFAGILSHSGHAYDRTAAAARARVAEEERVVMVDFADRLREHGVDVPQISVGSTPSMMAADNLEGVDEGRPGNYALFDYFQARLGSCDVTHCAATVLSAVVSSQPSAGHCVIDAGALALSKDRGPVDEPQSMGRLMVDHDTLDDERYVTSLSQEHGKLNATLRVGTRVRVLPNHVCLAMAQFDECYVVEGDAVIDRWKVWRGRN